MKTNRSLVLLLTLSVRITDLSTPTIANTHTLVAQELGEMTPSREVQKYDRAIKINPNAAQASFIFGVTKYKSGDKRDAIGYFDRAIQLNPSFAEAYYNRGNSKSDLGDKQGAIADCKYL